MDLGVVTADPPDLRLCRNLNELSANPFNPYSTSNPFGAGNPYSPSNPTNPYGRCCLREGDA